MKMQTRRAFHSWFISCRNKNFSIAIVYTLPAVLNKIRYNLLATNFGERNISHSNEVEQHPNHLVQTKIEPNALLLLFGAFYALLFFSRTNNKCVRDHRCYLRFEYIFAAWTSSTIFSCIWLISPFCSLVFRYRFHEREMWTKKKAEEIYPMRTHRYGWLVRDETCAIHLNTHPELYTASTKTWNEIEKVYDCIFDVSLSFDVKTCGARVQFKRRNDLLHRTC